ncbi:MAG: hypothetical protein K2K53_01435, partial [Oscillospiraceae bacterium]|nr:hypothetical protein [Oscillospiraceae bacterium]
AIRLPITSAIQTRMDQYICPDCETIYTENSDAVIKNDDGTVTLRCTHTDTVNTTTTTYICGSCQAEYAEGSEQVHVAADGTVTLDCNNMLSLLSGVKCPGCGTVYSLDANVVTINTAEDGTVTATLTCGYVVTVEPDEDDPDGEPTQVRCEHYGVEQTLTGDALVYTEQECAFNDMPQVDTMTATVEEACGFEGTPKTVEAEGTPISSFLRYRTTGTNLYETNGTEADSDCL